MSEYYRILHIERDADMASVKKAYHEQAQLLHPDKPTGSTETFQKLDKAYRVLRDPMKRSKYDRFGVDLEESDEDSPETQVIVLGTKVTRGFGAALIRTSMGGLVAVLRRWRPFRWLQLCGAMGLLLLACKRGAPQEGEVDVKTLGIRQGALALLSFGAVQVGWAAWGYETAILFVVASFWKPSTEVSTSWGIHCVQAAAAAVVACWTRGRWRRWGLVLAMEALALLMIWGTFSCAAALAVSTTEAALDRVANKVRQTIESQEQIIENQKQAVARLEQELETSQQALLAAKQEEIVALDKDMGQL